MTVYPPRKLFLTATLVSLGGNFHFGYQLMILNPSQPVLQTFINQSYHAHHGVYLTDTAYRLLWSVILNILTVGSFLTLPLVPFVADRWGRKVGLYFSSVSCVISTFPMGIAYAANSYELLTLGRFLIGFASALSAGFQSIYVNEISAAEYRGFLSFFNALFVEVGFFLANVIALPKVFGNYADWSWMFWVEMFPSLLLLACLPAFPESPKFLLQKNREKEAFAALRTYMEGEGQIVEIIEETKEELRLQMKSMGIHEVLKSPELRTGVLLGCFITFMVPFSGVVAVDYLTSFLLTQAGFSEEKAAYFNLAIVGCSLLAVMASMNLIDRYGRKPLLLISIFGMAGMNLLFLIIFEIYSFHPFPAAGYIFLVGACFFMFFFSSGPGPIQWFIAAELVPQNARSAATSLSLFFMYLNTFVAGFAFFPLEGVAGAWSFLMFIIPLITSGIFLFFKLPETKQRSIEAIIADMNSRKLPLSCL